MVVWCGFHFAVFSFDFLQERPYRLPPFGAFPPTYLFLLLIPRNQNHELFLYIRASSFCLCSLGSAIASTTSAYASVRTALLSSVLIFLVYILQGVFIFEVYWIFECGTSLRDALQVFVDSSWKWETHVVPCALFLFGALAGLAVVLLRCFS